MVFYSVVPVRSQKIKPNRIGRWIDDVEKACFEGGEFGRIDFAFKDGVLHPLAMVGAGLGGAAEAPSALRAYGRDVIGDKNIHGDGSGRGGEESSWMIASAGKEGRIGVKIPAQMAGEQSGLQMGQQSDGGLFIKEGVGDFLLFAFLPGRHHHLAGGVLKHHGSRFKCVKVPAGELFSIQEGERGAVGEKAAKFLHQIEGKRGPAGAITVEEAALGIQAAGLEGGPAVMGEQRIKE